MTNNRSRKSVAALSLATVAFVTSAWMTSSMASPISRLEQVNRSVTQDESATATSLSARDKASFIREYQYVLDSAVASYRIKDSRPLSAQIFDIEDPFINRVLTTTTRRAPSAHQDSFMAMQFYPEVQINHSPQPLCFILFNGAKSGLLQSYPFSNQDDTLDYLVIHEFGHCLIEHAKNLGHIPAMSHAQNEAFSDMFSMAFFLAQGRSSAAKSVLEIQQLIPKQSDHYHPESRSLFYEKWNKGSPTINDMHDLFSAVLFFYSQVKPSI